LKPVLEPKLELDHLLNPKLNQVIIMCETITGTGTKIVFLKKEKICNYQMAALKNLEQKIDNYLCKWVGIICK
jgi:hypothetical protein